MPKLANKGIDAITKSLKMNEHPHLFVDVYLSFYLKLLNRTIPIITEINNKIIITIMGLNIAIVINKVANILHIHR